SDLVGDRLTRQRFEEDRFCPRRAVIHRRSGAKIFGGLINREKPQREFHVDFNPERAKPHEVVDHLTRASAVVEESRLEHHLFSIKPDSFVWSGIIIMPPNRILVSP